MTEHRTHPRSTSNNRPALITMLSILFALGSLFSLLKFSQALLQWNNLKNLPLSISPAYLAIDGLVWWATGLVLSLALWRGKGWSRPAVMIFSIVYSLEFWVDKIWIAEPEGLAQRWPINLLLTIIGLGMILLVLSLKSTRDYFCENPAKIP